MKILVTGSCGFIGYHLCQRLVKDKHKVVGIDSFNHYYDVAIKDERSANLIEKKVDVIRGSLADPFVYTNQLPKDIDMIIHLAAQAGVRYGLKDPYSYIQNNVVAFIKLLQFAVDIKVKKFIYASSSSVYGTNQVPWNEKMKIEKPLSLYAATKISNEALAEECYESLGLNCVGLRFFTVYGPFGRPDMALWKWLGAIEKNEPIFLFNHGKMERSWTYIDDIISGIMLAVSKDFDGHQIFNLGNDHMVNIEYAADYMCNYLHVKPKKEYFEMQTGDVEKTLADLTKSRKMLGYNPETKFEDGVIKFIDWYKKWTKREA